VFVGGADAHAPERLQALQAGLSLRHSPQDEGVKAMLRQNTEQAQAQGVFGAPAFVVDGKVFWGFDSLPMLGAYLRGDPWFEAHWDDPQGIQDGLKA
jgi:2-hydroxychromene-2-carboxylate isomerase